MGVEHSDEERIKFLLDREAIFVLYKQVDEIFQKFEAIKEQGKQDRTVSMTLIASSGGGKTLLAKYYIHIHKYDAIHHDNFVERPVEIVRMPSIARPAALFERILTAYNQPHPKSGTISQKEQRVFDVLDISKTKLLFIDEVHNILYYGGERTQLLMLSLLKDIANVCKIPFILMGTSDAEKVIIHNEEVRRRFPVVKLKPLEDTEELGAFLAGFEKRLPLRKPSNLASNADMMGKIFAYSHGLVDDISALIRVAAVIAIKSKTEQITIKEILQAEQDLKDRRYIG